MCVRNHATPTSSSCKQHIVQGRELSQLKERERRLVESSTGWRQDSVDCEHTINHLKVRPSVRACNEMPHDEQGLEVETILAGVA